MGTGKRGLQFVMVQMLPFADKAPLNSSLIFSRLKELPKNLVSSNIPLRGVFGVVVSDSLENLLSPSGLSFTIFHR